MLSLIAAVATNGAVGKDNTIPWRLPGDLWYFKNITSGKTLVMGRKTFESLPALLPNRRHIVITKKSSYSKSRPGIETAQTFNSAIKKADVKKNDVFVIGGSRVYRDALPLCDRLYITELYAEFEADAFFPEVDYSQFELVSKSEMFNECGLDYRFFCYHAIKKEEPKSGSKS
jgi:dihydrofolate reductase